MLPGVREIVFGEACQCDCCGEPGPGHVFLLPAHIPLRPCWPNLHQGQRVESLLEHSTVVSILGQKAGFGRLESDSEEADGRQPGHLDIPSDWLVLVVRYLWRSQIVQGGRAVLWSQRVWDRITSAHLLTERFSAS